MLDLNTYVLNELIHERQNDIQKEVEKNRFQAAACSQGIRRQRFSLRKRIGLGMIALGEVLAGVKVQQRVPLQ